MEVRDYTAEAAMEKTPVMEKPPLGAAPYKFVATNRVNELLGAIGRYVNAGELNEKTMKSLKLWTTELNEQIDLLGTMLIYDT